MKQKNRLNRIIISVNWFNLVEKLQPLLIYEKFAKNLYIMKLGANYEYGEGLIPSSPPKILTYLYNYK